MDFLGDCGRIHSLRLHPHAETDKKATKGNFAANAIQLTSTTNPLADHAGPCDLCTINWADSGPGFSWPESYHVTYLPGFDKFVITSSRDGPDAWGCSDHAIGVADGNLEPIEAAKEVITEFWRMQRNAWEQSRWAYLFDEGLIDEKTANVWADEVWCPEEEEEADAA